MPTGWVFADFSAHEANTHRHTTFVFPPIILGHTRHQWRHTALQKGREWGAGLGPQYPVEEPLSTLICHLQITRINPTEGEEKE